MSPGLDPDVTQPGFVQGTVFYTPTRVSSTTVSLGPVGAGDLLVGWFGQYNAAGQVEVSDDVNGPWARSPGSTAFQNDTGDIALYYVANSKAAQGGLTVTVTASAQAYFQGALAEYNRVAVAGPLDRVVAGRGVGTAVDTGPTSPVAAGELVYSALITGGNPQSVTAGSSDGVAYVPRAQTTNGSAFEEDILSGAAGAQNGRATLGASTDWYAVVATFLPTSTDSQPPTVPTGPQATSVAASSVSLAWSASTDDVGVTGYTIYRDGTAIGTVDGRTTSFTDTTVAPASTYTYTVDAFDAAGNHSAQSTGVQVTTPEVSPAFVQGVANSPGTRATSAALVLSGPVGEGDLLAGWFAQYDAPGQVQVSDDVNGAWTRGISETFTYGGVDIALYYVQNSAAAGEGLTVTQTASAPTYLPGAVAEFSGVAAAGALDQAAAGKGTGTAADSGQTAAVGAGELVVGGLLTGGQPLTVTPGSSRNVPYTLVVHNGSESADISAILSSAAGTQHASFALARAMDWYALCAVFHPAAADTEPPTVPTNLHATSVAANSVGLAWTASTDDVGVTGYTVYRNGSVLATTNGATTSYSDSTVVPNTTYDYAVDAFDGAGNHSAQSAGVQVTTPSAAASFVQATAGTTGSRVPSTTLTLPGAVAQGDLLVGWFAQYDAAGQVQVSDNVNGAWTRGAGEHFSSGGGDIALYYVQNAAAAANGVTVTLAATTATYLQGTAANYRGIATTGSPLASAVAEGNSTAVDSGATASVAAGSVVFAAMLTGGNPGSATPGQTNGVPLVRRAGTASGSVCAADALDAASGAQHAVFTLGTATDWYAVGAAFRPA